MGGAADVGKGVEGAPAGGRAADKGKRGGSWQRSCLRRRTREGDAMFDRLSKPWQKRGRALKSRLAVSLLFVGSFGVLAIAPASAWGITVGTCDLDTLPPPRDCQPVTGLGMSVNGAEVRAQVFYEYGPVGRTVEVYIETELLDPFLDGQEA